MPQPEASALIDLVVASATRVLAGTWGGSVHLLPEETDKAVRYRSTVVRCRVEGGRDRMPETVIVKGSRGDPIADYDLDDLDPKSGAGRLLNEWAGTEFLYRLTAEAPLCARVYGGDRANGVIVLEDLGDGPCLADLLQGSDPAQARAGLVSYATGLGRLHAATVGRADPYRAARAGLGLPPLADRSAAVDGFLGSRASFREASEGLGVAWSAEVDRELNAVAAIVSDPGPFLAFTPGDTCPDNHRIANGQIRFFDFEFCGFWHALLDLTYLWLPFPTCWCVNRLPPGLVRELTEAYRTELARGCSAANDADFGRATLLACALWTITTIGNSLTKTLDEDDRWGIATLRQRHLLRLETFIAGADEIGHLPALADVARDLRARLRQRWGEATEMPLYPAFRDQA